MIKADNPIRCRSKINFTISQKGLRLNQVKTLLSQRPQIFSVAINMFKDVIFFA